VQNAIVILATNYYGSYSYDKILNIII